jgi:5-methylcytosine-specific restriction endonuclease McrA
VPPSGGPGRTGWAWRKLRAQVIAESSHCHLCGGPLYPDIPNPQRMATVVDHLVSLIEGGAPMERANLAAAHRICNQRKEAARRRQRRLNASRDW